MTRLIVTIFLGTMAFNMQDVLLEPYGGEILGLSVSARHCSLRCGQVVLCLALALLRVGSRLELTRFAWGVAV